MGEEQSTGGKRAQEVKEAWDNAEEKVQKLEEDPPKDLSDWPDDEAKYVTFGGAEGDHGYDEGPEAKLGPSSTKRHEDGSVEEDGEKIDNPDERKMEPVEMQTQSLHERKKGNDDEGGDDDG